MKNIKVYGEWLEEWVKVYKVPYIKPSSVTRINYVIKMHVPSWLKEMPLKSVKAIDVDRALAECPLQRSRKYLYYVLTSSLKKAYCLDLIKTNVKDKVETVRYRKRKGKALTLTEQEEFLQAIENCKYRYYYEFLLLTGCRRSEALALRWGDVDEKLMNVYIHGTKTESSERTIFLNSEILTVLNKQRAQSVGDLIFPYEKANVTHAFKRYCPAHKLHDLRHTFVTRCAESGININVAQRLAGHSDISTTLQIYTHVTSEFQRQEFAKFKLKR